MRSVSRAKYQVTNCAPALEFSICKVTRAIAGSQPNRAPLTSHLQAGQRLVSRLQCSAVSERAASVSPATAAVALHSKTGQIGNLFIGSVALPEFAINNYAIKTLEAAAATSNLPTLSTAISAVVRDGQDL